MGLPDPAQPPPPGVIYAFLQHLSGIVMLIQLESLDMVNMDIGLHRTPFSPSLKPISLSLSLIWPSLLIPKCQAMSESYILLCCISKTKPFLSILMQHLSRPSLFHILVIQAPPLWSWQTSFRNPWTHSKWSKIVSKIRTSTTSIH